jgi:hypothetical protein
VAFFVMLQGAPCGPALGCSLLFSSPISIAGAVFAALAILGTVPVRRFYAPLIALFTALAAAASLWLTSTAIHPVDDLVARFCLPSHPDCNPNPPDYSWVVGVGALLLYLVAATLYGFAGRTQGTPVGMRALKLVLLLLSIIPVLNVLGLAGFVVTAVRRGSARSPNSIAAAATRG